MAIFSAKSLVVIGKIDFCSINNRNNRNDNKIQAIRGKKKIVEQKKAVHSTKKLRFS